MSNVYEFAPKKTEAAIAPEASNDEATEYSSASEWADGPYVQNIIDGLREFHETDPHYELMQDAANCISDMKYLIVELEAVLGSDRQHINTLHLLLARNHDLITLLLTTKKDTIQ